MPPTNSPTLRQRRLGAELRKLRERAGLTATGAAELLGVNQSRVSMIETGRTPISADRLRSMAHVYDCSDEALIDALAAMTGRRARGWWEGYREHLPAALVDLAELEHYATGLRVTLALRIPALLQTTDHARALFQAVVPSMRQYEIEHRLTHRIKRQGILHREQPPRYAAIIHESALRMRFGGPDVRRGRLQHLLDMSELPHVSVRVIPFDTESYPSTGQSFDYVEGQVPQLDTVQLDTQPQYDDGRPHPRFLDLGGLPSVRGASRLLGRFALTVAGIGSHGRSPNASRRGEDQSGQPEGRL